MTSKCWIDCETTSLKLDRRAWEIALITRHRDEPDIEWRWFIHPLDLDLSNADPTSLEFGHFYERHPHGPYLKAGGDVEHAPKMLGVFREAEVLLVVARETADRAMLYGSNPAFDVYTLEPRMHALDITPGWHYHPEDVPTLVKGWLLGQDRPLPEGGKSDDYCRAVGVNPDTYDRHTALGDCRLFRDVFDIVIGRAA